MRGFNKLFTLLLGTTFGLGTPLSAAATSYFSFSIGGPGYRLNYGTHSYGAHRSYGYINRGYKRPYTGHGVHYRGYRHYYRNKYYQPKHYGYVEYYGPYGSVTYIGGSYRGGYRGGYRTHHGYHGSFSHRGHWGSRRFHRKGHARGHRGFGHSYRDFRRH